MPVNAQELRRRLREFDFTGVMVEELGWNYHQANPLPVAVDGQQFALNAVAEKSGLVVYACGGDGDGQIPSYPMRQKIERQVAKSTFEHLVIFHDAARTTQYWQWVRRQAGKPAAWREQVYRPNQTEEPLIQKLQRIAFDLEEEEGLNIAVVAGRVQKSLDVDRVTKRFYDRFKTEHDSFLEFIEGLDSLADSEWYASLMLNRLMFVYFIQKKGFLDGDQDYLRSRLERTRQTAGKDRFQRFYRLFLLRLFHEGLAQPEANRAPELAQMLGNVPYLNGGLFEVHDLEKDNPDIHIPDEAFEKLFGFFDGYAWHLDERPLRADNEINPDVLGYIFEKYINQKELGAYYTKEDITGYISRNTVIPSVFDSARKECPVAFQPGGGVWRLLQEEPDRYIYPAVRKGAELALSQEIAAGIDDVSKRQGWNRPAPEEYALPTETWREVVARRKRYEEVFLKLAGGEVQDINELITLNLDICRFAEDVIIQSEGPELVKAFWDALDKVSVLDPACGSGAFLFAALNVLEPLYTACLEGMRGFLDDLETSARRHHPDALKPFREVLAQVVKHPNQRHFVLKSIVINNLFGVDIVEEAVEICKLRLFLKLVAQVETYSEIEPLPDIDFNIRAGNTLVGFTSLDALRDAMRVTPKGQARMPSAEDEKTLARIEEDAEVADRAFQKFREMQTLHGMDADRFVEAKTELRRRLDGLRGELDRYLANQYGVDVHGPEKYRDWQVSHQPFHWFVEFYGIMKSGGFDSIIGNPPWREYSAVKRLYSVAGYITEPCGNLHALFTERGSVMRAQNGHISFIVQLPMASSSRMAAVRQLLAENSKTLHLTFFDDRPGKLFDGLQHCRSVIFNASKRSEIQEPNIYVTRYQRWATAVRTHLFEQIQYVSVLDQTTFLGPFPKYADPLQAKAFKRLHDANIKSMLSFLSPKPTENFIFYQESLGYWAKATYGLPWYSKNKAVGAPPHGRYVYFEEPETAHAINAVLNSSLFYLYFIAYGDCFHLSDGLVRQFPVNVNIADDLALTSLNGQLMNELHDGSETTTITTKDGDTISYEEFFAWKSKETIDEIDRRLAKHYGFSDEELDFIINYDIKYRLGGAEADED